MMKIKINKFVSIKHYSEKNNVFDIFKPVRLVQNKKGKLFFLKQKFYTLFIDLDKTLEDILLDMKKNTRNEIKRAIKEGLTIEEDKTIKTDEWVNEYNSFAEYKKLKKLNTKYYEKFKNNIRVLKCNYEGKTLKYHVLLCDSKNRVRSLFLFDKFNEGVENKVYGWAGRLIHYKGIELFKEEGIKIYDFGGIAKDTTDPIKQGINKYKQSFTNNDFIQENHYSSPLYILYKLVSKK